jgi:hypothetical protein
MQMLKLTHLVQPLLVGLLLLSASTLSAQENADQATPSPVPAEQQATPAPAQTPSSTPADPQLKVTVVDGNLELDDIITMEVTNLHLWAETNDPTKLVPYLNGRAIKGNYPEEIHLSFPGDANPGGHVVFHLEITPENKGVWIDLLGEPSSMRKLVTVSMGLEDGSPFASEHAKGKPLTLTVISPVYGVVALIVILFTLVLLLLLASKTNVIREPGPPPAPGKKRPYNLGRAQMAFWFFLIYASYLTIWLITSALDTITSSLLALMGISAGTALGEAMIDTGKDTAQTNQFQDLTAEKQALEQSIPEAQAQLDATTDPSTRDTLTKQLTDNRTRLGQIEQQLRTLSSQQPAKVSSGFLRDVLSDSSGYSFHRFQIFAWTIVLGIIFVSSVYNNLTMPEFSTTLLGLMGLSAGTYIGFKFPEQK